MKSRSHSPLERRFQETCLLIYLGCSVLLCGCQSPKPSAPGSAAEELAESTDPDRPSPPVPMTATLLGDFANLELTISADRAGLIQKVEISKPSQAKIFDEPTRAWVEKHWKMPTAQASEPDSRVFIAPIVYPKTHFPAGGKYPAPEYPSYLIRDGIRGVVILEIDVAESGHVESSTVFRSSGYKNLDDHTSDWVLKHWLFPAGKKVLLWRCEYQIR